MRSDDVKNLLGMWDGFDAHTGLPGRNVIPLSEMDGKKIRLCDAVYSKMRNRISDYIKKTEIQLTKDTVIESEKLPAGRYKARFVIRDVFNNENYSDFFTVNWDGDKVFFKEKK